MSISADTLQHHLKDPAVFCCRRQKGIVIGPGDLEDPTLFEEMIASGLIALDARGLNIEQALGMPDITSDAMRRAIDGWFDAWFSRVSPDEEDPCQRIPYVVVNKLGKAVFAEYDSSLQNTGIPKLQYLDRARQAFDAKKRELLQ